MNKKLRRAYGWVLEDMEVAGFVTEDGDVTALQAAEVFKTRAGARQGRWKCPGDVVRKVSVTKDENGKVLDIIPGR